ncbi:hypothetical protein AKJ40_03350 [candidate division MSBL1 archaeon SCGC-AAA259M10]|uniref:Uncharacterized protein n=1 Tax=candidate division MSBL1 archaeon SCGC-AAA259M10 TaxID=1698270 RepID=A0A133UYU3_9EURY|nr:hypothetical protein AKJ40_03350 [candidate division MSBL1 archaeon SCGC-AAA259M10]
MTAILPKTEDRLNFTEENGEFSVLYDGTGINSRNDRIEKLSSEDLSIYRDTSSLLKCDPEEIKSEIERGKRIIVFSQEIDLTGESLDAPSLSKFKKNIGDINKVIETLQKGGVETVYVITDHGFLYKPREMASESVSKPEGNIVKFGRRYAIGRDLNSDFVIFPNIKDYGIDSDLDFAFPRSLGTFKKRGGSRKYLHGGISLQEMIVPVVRIVSNGKETEKKTVVKITDVPDRIANPYFKVGVKLVSSALDTGEKRVRIEPKQFGKEIGDNVYCSAGVTESTATVKLDLDEVEDQSGELELYFYDDETEVLIDQKQINLDLVYTDGEI